MSTIIVTDSTCLIGLERIGQLEVLPALFQLILIPPAVQMEFGTTSPWLQVETIADVGLALALKMLVDEGEAEAITLAYERGYKIILDDRQARHVDRNMQVPFIGTVGVLVKAKQAGVISALKPLLDALELNGFYLSQALKAEAIKLAGEA